MKEETRRLVDLVSAENMWVTQLSALRKIRGLTQAELADRMGLDQPQISRLENVNSPGSPSARKLLEYAHQVNAYVAHVVVPAEQGYEPLKDELQQYVRQLLMAAEDGSASSVVKAAVGRVKYHVPEAVGDLLSVHLPARCVRSAGMYASVAKGE